MQFPHRYKQSSLCPIIPVDHDGGEISRKIYQTHQTKDKALSNGRFLIIIQNVEWADSIVWYVLCGGIRYEMTNRYLVSLDIFMYFLFCFIEK